MDFMVDSCRQETEHTDSRKKMVASRETTAPTLALHGGAGTITRGKMTPEREAAYRAGLDAPLAEGERMLRDGADALDVVVRVVAMLEDNPLFNAGRGAVFTHDGTHEMDASVMRGSDRAAGAIAGVTGVRNPVALAQLVMEQTDHVMLAGRGAEEFARSIGVPFEDADYFHDELRHRQLLKARDAGRVQLDHTEESGGAEGNDAGAGTSEGLDEKKFGTVGAVACDVHGHLAAATSTGGMTNKKYGRVGDSPIIGAGTWADDATCAVSCTGHGENFIRTVAAYDLACLMEYRGMSLAEAADELVMNKLPQYEAEGGLIAVDTAGTIVLPFNSEGMYRASSGPDGRIIAIYGEDELPA